MNVYNTRVVAELLEKEVVVPFEDVEEKIPIGGKLPRS